MTAAAAGNIGDPTIQVYVCSATIEEAARNFADSVPMEDVVVPQNDNYEARPVAIPDGVRADEAEVACVWGTPANCRAWAFLARYGSEVLSASFTLAGEGGGLDETAWAAFVESLDSARRSAASGSSTAARDEPWQLGLRMSRAG